MPPGITVLVVTLGLLAALALILPSCALLRTAGDLVGDAVNDYCRETLTDRNAFRAVLNQRTAPHRVNIDCAGDPTPTPTPRS